MALPNHFDRSKPFYPLVMNYLVTLVGFKEIVIWGGLGRRSDRVPEIVELLLHLDENPPSDALSTRQFAERLLRPLQLRSEFQGDHIEVSTETLASEMMSNGSYLLSFTMRSAGVLLMLAHELTKDSDAHDSGPLWEFLRHCRNAVAHNGCFTFTRDEPRRPAAWGKFEIERSWEGLHLFKDYKGSGLLSPGDPIRLLWDIEQAYPDLAT